MLSRPQKTQQIAWLKEVFSSLKPVVLVGFRGLKINELTDLRRRVKGANAQLKVVKTSLLEKSLKALDLKQPASLVGQPVAVLVGNSDEIELAKTAVGFQRDHELLRIYGGVIEQQVVDEGVVKQLATIPSRAELYGQLVGSVSAPFGRLVIALRWHGYRLTNVLKQRLATLVG